MCKDNLRVIMGHTNTGTHRGRLKFEDGISSEATYQAATSSKKETQQTHPSRICHATFFFFCCQFRGPFTSSSGSQRLLFLPRASHPLLLDALVPHCTPVKVIAG